MKLLECKRIRSLMCEIYWITFRVLNIKDSWGHLYVSVLLRLANRYLLCKQRSLSDLRDMLMSTRKQGSWLLKITQHLCNTRPQTTAAITEAIVRLKNHSSWIRWDTGWVRGKALGWVVRLQYSTLGLVVGLQHWTLVWVVGLQNSTFDLVVGLQYSTLGW